VIHTKGMWPLKEDLYAHSYGGSTSSDGRENFDAN
jgi:hypothetical protein